MKKYELMEAKRKEVKTEWRRKGRILSNMLS